MKTTLKRTLAALLAVLVLLPLAGCGQEAQNTPGNAQTNAGEKTPTSGDKSGGGTSTEAKAETNDSTNTSDSTESVETEAPYPMPDYSDFVMPEETGELTVYSSGMLGLLLTPAVEIFREKYPSVNVNLITLDPDEFAARVQTEIPAGSGPDLLLCHANYDIPDPYKIMTTGLFADLNPYFLNDPDFNFDDYLTGAMECGVFQGKRMLVPVEILLPLYKSSRENLADAGIDPDKIETLEDFCAACLQYHEKKPDNALFSSGGDNAYMRDLLYASGMQFIDYANYKPAVDEEKLRAILDVCRAFYAEDGHPVGGEYIQIDGVWERMFLGSNISNSSPLILLNDMILLEGEGETPYFLPVKDIYGGSSAEVVYFAAIPQASENKLNAYRLLQILLSKDIQSGYEKTGMKAALIRIGSPVRKASIMDHLNNAKEMFFGDYPGIDDKIQLVADFCSNVTSGTILPSIIYRYLNLEMMPYVRGEKPWDDCYKRFLNTLELYASE